MALQLKVQISQVQKQTRQVLNKNMQMQDETAEFVRAAKIKSKKANDLMRQREELEKGAAEADSNHEELERCKMLLSIELAK